MRERSCETGKSKALNSALEFAGGRSRAHTSEDARRLPNDELPHLHKLVTSSGEHPANQPAILETGIWNLGCGRMNWIMCMGYPARIMALSSWRMKIQIPDSRFQIPPVSGLAKMTLSEYPCFQTASPKALGEVCRWKLETGNWKLSGTSWQR